ncbi:MAG TPA: glycosyltransferase family 4 protein [Thermoguttaceae bacterium]|nr:glycosyltransferase family 4 protein [Thermoguttaceae bacterium]
MPNLLLLCEYPTLSGGERSMLATLDGVRRGGFEPAVIGPGRGALAEALQGRGVEVVPFESFSVRPRPSLDRMREELARVLRRRRADLLHANSLSMGRLSGPVAAELGVPSLAHLRDIVRLSRQAAADLNCHTRLLAVSGATRDYHVAGGLDGGKLHVLYNGVDLEAFRPRPATGFLHRELGLAADAQLVGTIGQIALRKGQDVLARAAARLVHESARLHFVVVGERYSGKAESRRFEADLQAAARGPLAGRFHFLGFRDDVDRLLNELTLLVHPARQEPLGRVLLEAAASGVAVIATDIGGTREIFPPDSRSARLVEPDDADGLAAAILELSADGSQRRQLAAAARRRAEEAFDLSGAAERLVGHYREVVKA